MTVLPLAYARSLLFLPASNARAAEKAQGLACDMVILDLEDAVPEGQKENARTGAISAIARGYPGKLIAVRINMAGTPWHDADLALVAHAKPDFIVLPKVEHVSQVDTVHAATGVPVIAMVETALGVLAAQAVAAHSGTVGLFMGNNDLRTDLKIPETGDRTGLMLALQSVVLAARAHGKCVFDGVYNRLDDAEGFEAECLSGRALGFDGKTLIHPNQIEIANRVFGPDEKALDAAKRLVAAFTGGAERYEGRMIESMHVADARALIARAEALVR